MMDKGKTKRTGQRGEVSELERLRIENAELRCEVIRLYGVWQGWTFKPNAALPGWPD